MLRCVLLALAVLIIGLGTAAGAKADGTVTWGVSGVTPTMDTANGDYQDSATTSDPDNDCPDGIVCSPEHNPKTGENPILPAPYPGENTSDVWHSASDLAVWNTAPSLVAPERGQILTVRVTGCAVQDPRSPSQESQGTPVNTILFQTLAPAGSDWDNLNYSHTFELPFCNRDGTTAQTVSTYHPLHLCINAGDALALHGIGGFVDDNGNAYYPQGIPLQVLAAQSGQATASYVGISNTYGPGSEPTGLGFATESDQEVTMQVIEASGNDAWEFCPGGFGDEPAQSNAIDCEYHHSAVGSHEANPVKYPDHPFCAGTGKPIPGSNLPPNKPGSTNAVRAPVITRLRFNPPLFVAARGSTVTYRDSEPGLTTLRFYRVEHGHDVLVKTVHHRDKVDVGLHVGGLRPGDYVVSLTSVYRRVSSRTARTRITVIARR